MAITRRTPPGFTPTGSSVTVANSTTPIAIRQRADFVTDGSDDTATFNAAIDEVKASGGKVEVMPGTYSAADILMYRSVYIEGAGPFATIINLKTGGTTLFKWATTETTDNEVGGGLSGMKIDGGDQASSVGIDHTQMNGNRINNWVMHDMQIHDFAIGQDTGTANIRYCPIERVRFQSCTVGNEQNAGHFLWNNCEFRQVGTALTGNYFDTRFHRVKFVDGNIYDSDSGANTIQHTQFSDCAFLVSNAGNGLELYRRNSVTNCYFTQTSVVGNYAILLNGNNNTIEGNTFHHQSSGNGYTEGCIVIANNSGASGRERGTRIIDNFFKNEAGPLINFRASAQMRSGAINNNTFVVQWTGGEAIDVTASLASMISSSFCNNTISLEVVMDSGVDVVSITSSNSELICKDNSFYADTSFDPSASTTGGGAALNVDGRQVALSGNTFRGGFDETITLDPAPSAVSHLAVIFGNIGWATQAKGTATLANGNTSIAVTHGLAVTPALHDIQITPQESLGSASEFRVTAVSSTTFTITVDTNPGADVDFSWRASVYSP